MRPIPEFAALRPSSLCVRRRPLPAPFATRSTTWTYNARAALWAILQTIDVEAGTNFVVPAYNCGAEIAPFAVSGAELRFYRVDARIRVDVESLRAATDASTGAVLVTHYFGFPEPLGDIVRIARENGALLIEDCAHSLYSASPQGALGTTGDAAVFSLWKSLPVPDGGALVTGARLHPEQPAQRPPRAEVTARLAELVKVGLRSSRSDAVRGALNRYRNRNKSDSNHDEDAREAAGGPTFAIENPDFSRERARWSISRSSKLILGHTDGAEVVARRRHNFAALLAEFGDRSPFDSLPADVCPLLFPLMLDDPIRAHADLLEAGIETTRWWQDFHPAFPREQFPEPSHLKTHVLGLPIHQDIDDADLSRIISCVGSLL